MDNIKRELLSEIGKAISTNKQNQAWIGTIRSRTLDPMIKSRVNSLESSIRSQSFTLKNIQDKIKKLDQ